MAHKHRKLFQDYHCKACGKRLSAAGDMVWDDNAGKAWHLECWYGEQASGPFHLDVGKLTENLWQARFDLVAVRRWQRWHAVSWCIAMGSLLAVAILYWVLNS